jgi:long-subunit fatty acid transport protein
MTRSEAVRVVVRWSLFVFAAALPLTASSALAGGLELVGPGVHAVGRGGAVAAKAEDATVLIHNPAGLAELRGSQLLLDMTVPVMAACVDPIGYYGWGVYAGGRPARFTDARTGEETTLNLGNATMLGEAERAYYVDPLDTVCMQPRVLPIPELAATLRLTEDLGIGFGMMFPAVTPQGQWGDAQGLIRNAEGELRPAPTRYMLMNTGTLAIFPTVGVGYRITRWLRVGAAFDWGMIWADATTMVAISAGTSPDTDVVARLRAQDYFVPGYTLSVHLVPVDSIDVVVAYRHQDAIDASGKADLLTGRYKADARERKSSIDVTSVFQRMPWKLRGGLRYADRLAPRPTGTGHREPGAALQLLDAFATERWDVELDVEYQGNSVHQRQEIQYRQGQSVAFESLDGTLSTAQFPDPTMRSTFIDKHWRDQVSVRLGGSYNVLPGVLGVSAGAHYETRGVDPAYMQVDFWPVQRVGLHGGLRFRIGGTTDVLVSYAHIFQETITVAAPPQQDAQEIYRAYVAGQPVRAIDRTVGTRTSRGQALPVQYERAPKHPDGTAKLAQVVTKTQGGQPPWIVNAGTYRSAIDVIAVGVHAHF